MSVATAVASFKSTLRNAFPMKSIYQQTTVDPVSSAAAPVQNAVTLGGQAEHASLPSLSSPSTDSGYLGALPRPITQSLGGVSNATGIPVKWLAIGGAVLLVLVILHFARR